MLQMLPLRGVVAVFDVRLIVRMNRSFKLAVLLLLTCFGSAVVAKDDLVVIEDYVVGGDYEIIEVDGHPPERAKHGLFVTVVPLVLVAPGPHALTLKGNKAGLVPDNGENEQLFITVVNGKRYRLVRENGSPSLIEVGVSEK